MDQAGPSGSASQQMVVQQAKTQEFQLGTQKHVVRILGTEEEPWFVAADIGKVLGMERVSQHLGNYKEGTEKGVREVLTPGGVQKMIVLSEMATYKFLMRSQKPEAEPFQEWVAVVLKKIRLEGRYELQSSQTKLLEDAESARKRADKAEVALEKEKLKTEKLKAKLENRYEPGEIIYVLQNGAINEGREIGRAHV